MSQTATTEPLTDPLRTGRDAWSALALTTPGARWFAFAAMVLSFVLPANGLGIDLCGVHRFTGLPCPGCGLSRAFIAVADGELAEALAWNPFVAVLWPLFFALALLALLPRGMRARVEGWMSARATGLGRAYRVGVFAFLGFGAFRFAWFLLHGDRFP